MVQNVKKQERFRIIRPLGVGSFGQTYLVNDRNRNNEQVVIKVPHDKDRERALINELMQNQALKTAMERGSSHPNIVKFYGFDLYGDFYVIILEYVHSHELRKDIGRIDLEKRDPLPISRAVEIITSICSGLAIAHKIELIHRDIKPENILIRETDGLPKLLDFGISKIMASSAGSGFGTAGTIPYMAPEALHGKPCKASDTWSLSVVLYELVTGCLPFFDENIVPLATKIQKDIPIPPKSLNSDIDERLEKLILKGLEKNAKRRFTDAQAMLDALLSYEFDEQIARLKRDFQRGNEIEAERQVLVLLEKVSFEPRLYQLLAENYCRSQQYSGAAEILERGIKACPENASLHFYLAPVLWQQGQDKSTQAILTIEQAIKLGLTSRQERHAKILIHRWKEGVS